MTILVIQDDQKMANYIKRILEEEQYQVRTATDGEEGFTLALEKPFDLIVLDWILPNKDGLSILKDLRWQKNMTPILMLTGKDTIEDIVAGFDAGCDGYLTKPFAFAELLSRIRALKRRSERDRGAKIRFANLLLDPITHKVWRNGNEINLTAKEYGLLEYFIRHPDLVVTRAMIAEHVWDCIFDNFTNIIDVYVNYLRKKIDLEDSKKLIHTVRGVGYIFKKTE